MSKDNGGSAFPVVSYVKPDGIGSHIMTIDGGMTLRDYFAAKAMQAFISANVALITSVPELSYQMADAMLKERNK